MWPPTTDVDEWRHVLAERVAIMAESGVPDAERRARRLVEAAWRERRNEERPGAQTARRGGQD